MVVSTIEYVIPTYILGEAVGMPHWDGGRRDANTQNPVNLGIHNISTVCIFYTNSGISGRLLRRVL